MRRALIVGVVLLGVGFTVALVLDVADALLQRSTVHLQNDGEQGLTVWRLRDETGEPRDKDSGQWVEAGGSALIDRAWSLFRDRFYRLETADGKSSCLLLRIANSDPATYTLRASDARPCPPVVRVTNDLSLPILVKKAGLRTIEKAVPIPPGDEAPMPMLDAAEEEAVYRIMTDDATEIGCIRLELRPEDAGKTVRVQASAMGACLP